MLTRIPLVAVSDFPNVKTIAQKVSWAKETPPSRIPFFVTQFFVLTLSSFSLSQQLQHTTEFKVERKNVSHQFGLGGMRFDVVVLNCCVSETKETPLASRASTILAKSERLRVSRSTL